MSSKLASESKGGLTQLAHVCGRLVHPSVVDANERARQHRFISVALAGPLFVAAAFAQMLTLAVGVSGAFAAICLVLVAGWSLALVVAQTGRRSFAELAALAGAVPCAALLLHLAGGVQSPMLLLLLPLVVEPYFVARSRASLRTGVAAASAAFVASLALTALLPGLGTSAPAAWQWFLPAGYLATVWVRRGALLVVSVPSAVTASQASLEDTLPALTIRFAASGDVTDASAQCRDMLGLEPEFMLGGGLVERVHVTDRIAYLSALADLRKGRPHCSVELRLRLPSAGYRPFALELMQAPAGADGFVGLLRDNSEMAGLRQALTEADAKAELGKSRFLATVSHELRTPLNSIIGFSDMLLSGMAGPLNGERQREYVGLVHESGQHLLAIVNAILDVAKIEAGTYSIRPEWFPLAEAVETSRAIISYQAKAKGVDIDCDVSAEVGQVFADRRAMQQILINLLSNAVKFTPEGGKVAVSAQKDGDRLTIAVSDTGIGMSEDDLCRIGRPFVQVLNDYTRQYEGTGLGLSLVKGLVELQRGSMTIESAPGKGTVVTIAIRTKDKAADSQDRFNAETLAIPSANSPRKKAHAAFRQSA